MTQGRATEAHHFSRIEIPASGASAVRKLLVLQPQFGEQGSPPARTELSFNEYGSGRIQTANAQPRLQLLPVAPAQPKYCSIVEQHVEFAILVELQTADPIESDDGRTVNAAKDALIQLLIELRQAAA